MPVNAQSVAHDLARFDNRRRVREAVAADVAERPRVHALPKQKPAVKTKSPLSLWSVLCFMAAMILMYMVVMSYVQAHASAAQAAQMSRQISKLKTEETVLRAEYEQKINLAEIERVAIEELGMIRPTREQIVYLKLAGESHAEKIEDADGQNPLYELLVR